MDSGVHKEGVLPQQPGVVDTGLPLGQLLVARDKASVEVVVEVGSGDIEPVAVPAKGEVIGVLEVVDIAKVVVERHATRAVLLLGVPGTQFNRRKIT